MTTPVTTAVGEGWAPSVVSTFDPDDKLKEALITQCTSWAGSVDGDAPSVLVPYVATDPTAGIVAEAGSMTPNEGSYSQIVINTAKIAVVTRMSSELTGQAKAAERIANSIRRAVIAKADDYFLNVDTTTKGLFKITGIDSTGTLGGEDGNLMDAYDAVGAIEDDGGTATHWLINPADWAELCKIPERADSNKSLLADVHNAAARTLAGVPVIVHAAVTAGTAMVLDRSEVVSAYGELELARSDEAFFTSDAVALRATWRVGWKVVRTARLRKLTVTAWSDGSGT